MSKKLAAAAVAVFSLGQMASAAVDFNDLKANNLKEVFSGPETSVPVPSASDVRTEPVKEWTVMVYINGKNDLESSGVKDANEMEMVGSSDKVNIVLELGRIANYDNSDGNWTGVRRYLIQKDTDTSVMNSPVVEDLGKSDMGDYRNIMAFGNWAKAKYPAKKYMFIIWNHGSGWIDKSLSPKGISYDEESGNHLTTPQMAQVLKGIGGVDIYGSDACLMQMAEVAAEIKDHASYIAGSEETMPADGYTYNTLLAPLVGDPAMTPENLGRLVVDSVTEYYLSINKGSTQSLLRSAAIPGFMAAADGFAAALIAADERALADRSGKTAQSFAYPVNRDMYHFVRLVTVGTKNADVKAKGEALMQYMKETLIVYNRTANAIGFGEGWDAANYDDAYGLAVYIPGAAASSGYADLVWSKQGLWDELIAWMAKPMPVQQTPAIVIPGLLESMGLQ
jgi:hypothetical protein